MISARYPSSCVLISVLVALIVIISRSSDNNTDRSMSLIAVQFEVFGRVQGVFFRKFTNEKALSLGLRGWVKNTRWEQSLVCHRSQRDNYCCRDGTVTGELEGDTQNINNMKTWLQTTGSPSSRIEKAVFTNQRNIDKYSFDTFKIIRWIELFMLILQLQLPIAD